LLVGDAAVEALLGQDAEFGFGEIKPTAALGGVASFETLDQAACFGGPERFAKRGLAVDVEIILDEHDGLGVGSPAKAYVLLSTDWFNDDLAQGDGLPQRLRNSYAVPQLHELSDVDRRRQMLDSRVPMGRRSRSATPPEPGRRTTLPR
jgi:hypothetical protein